MKRRSNWMVLIFEHDGQTARFWSAAVLCRYLFSGMYQSGRGLPQYETLSRDTFRHLKSKPVDF